MSTERTRTMKLADWLRAPVGSRRPDHGPEILRVTLFRDGVEIRCPDATRPKEVAAVLRKVVDSIEAAVDQRDRSET
jgi:hypothetical protein